MTMTRAHTSRRTDDKRRDSERSRRRSSVRTRVGGAALVLWALLSALACSYVFAVWLPTDAARYRDYEASEVCPAHTAARRLEDCRREVTFTVADTVIQGGGRNVRYEATLTGAPYWNRTVSFGDTEPVLERLRPGDQVTATVWRGGIMTVSTQGLRQSTSDEPRDEPQAAAAIGTALGVFAVMALVFGAVQLTRPRDHEPFSLGGYGKPLLITMAVACVAVAAASFLLGIPWWIVPALVVPVVAARAWVLHRNRQASRPTETAHRPERF
ncbi:hypothetical protein [Streptomyces chrestomyceticus]|uniref:hypothetical protein n=1 Tax=Streptomyces chrestomyceticus TaxID=68185 RepID=UPI0037A18E9B